MTKNHLLTAFCVLCACIVGCTDEPVSRTLDAGPDGPNSILGLGDSADSFGDSSDDVGDDVGDASDSDDADGADTDTSADTADDTSDSDTADSDVVDTSDADAISSGDTDNDASDMADVSTNDADTDSSDVGDSNDTSTDDDGDTVNTDADVVDDDDDAVTAADDVADTSDSDADTDVSNADAETSDADVDDTDTSDNADTDTSDADADAPDDDADDTDTSDNADTDTSDADAETSDNDDDDADDTGDDSECGVVKPEARDRVVIVAHTFNQDLGLDGTDVRTLTFTDEGDLVDDGKRIDVGASVERIEFTSDGRFALVLAEGGNIISLKTTGTAADVQIVDSTVLTDAYFEDLAFIGDTYDAVIGVFDNQVDGNGGVYRISLACDGTLSWKANGYYPLLMVDAFAVMPSLDRLFVVGGQLTFEPINVYDMRLLSFDDDGFEEVYAGDIFESYIDAQRIAVSPDGSRVIVPNGATFSEEGGQVSLLKVAEDTIGEVDRLLDFEDAYDAMYGVVGAHFIVTQAYPDRISLINDGGGDPVVIDELSGLGLPDKMAMVSKGPLKGWLLISSVDANGQITVIQTTQGSLFDTQTLDLGDGYDNIPGHIAVEP